MLQNTDDAGSDLSSITGYFQIIVKPEKPRSVQNSYDSKYSL